MRVMALMERKSRWPRVPACSKNDDRGLRRRSAGGKPGGEYRLLEHDLMCQPRHDSVYQCVRVAANACQLGTGSKKGTHFVRVIVTTCPL